MEIKVDVRKSKDIKNFKEKVNNGLNFAGAAWKAANQKYPSKKSGSMRTGALGNTAAYQITRDGEEVVFQAKKYWKFLMYGTGIHGPFMMRIYPTRGKYLVWKSRDGLVFAKSSAGTIWPGKLDSIEDAVVRGFKQGIKEG